MSLIPRMKYCLAVLILFFSFAGQAQTSTTVTISDTVSLAGISRPGINLGGNGQYAALQLTKSLNVAGGGYMPAPYWQSSWGCNASGPANTTTSWYTDASDGTYPANFWIGASYQALNGATGAVLGSGTITASTANTSTGIAFTLGTPLSAACTTNQDVMIVRFRNPASNLTVPSDTYFISGCANAAWNAADKSPTSSNTMRSMELPSGCNLNFYLDQTIANATNTTNQAAINYINLNGSYTLTFKAKCLTAGCQLTFSLDRLGGTTFMPSTTVSPTYSATNGAGWTTYSYPFSASETGAQNATISYTFSTTSGTVLLQDADVIEGSTLAVNTTVFRDAVVRQLQALHPGSLRYMEGALWCSDVADQIAAVGNRRECDVNNWLKVSFSEPLGYNDVLQLANLIGSDAWLTLGQFNTPQDFELMTQFLADPGCTTAGGAARCALGQSASWSSVFGATGHKIYLEFGNETWNSGVPGGIWYGNGTVYGSLAGPAVAAARSTANYSSSVIKLVADGWAAGAQGWGPYGWAHNTLTAAQATANGLPDFIDAAPYTLGYLGAFATSGANVATTGAPFADEFAEITNLDSLTTPAANTTSMYGVQNYAFSTFGVNSAVYEVNLSDNFGIAVTQAQLNQISASVGSALITTQHLLLLQRDAKFAGPLHLFSFSEPFNGYNCQGSGCVAGVVMPLWGSERYMAAGPGQSNTWTDVSRPTAIALQAINQGIGNNDNLMQVTQSGTPTYSYGGGQPQGGSNTIAANAAVPYVNCTAYSDGATHWTLICFNNNLSTSEKIILAGAGAPTGSVTKTVFGGPANLITDNNENSYIGNEATPAVVRAPTATILTSLTSDSLPAASLTVYSYTVGAMAAPTGLAVTVSTASQIGLTWNASDSATGYTVYRNGGAVASVSKNSYVDSGLAASTAYTYTVAAFDASGDKSPQSGFVTGKTAQSLLPPISPIPLMTPVVK